MNLKDRTNIKKILLIRLRSIGDIILGGPAMEAVRTGFPTAEITCVVDDIFVDLVRGNPSVNRVLTFSRGRKGISRIFSDLGLFLKIFWEGYDLVIDFHGGPKSVLLTLISRAPIRVGHRHRIRNRVFNLNEIPSDNPHSYDNGLKLTRAIELPDPKKPQFYIPMDQYAKTKIQRQCICRGIGDDDFCVIIHPGARVWFKRWPNEKLYRVVDWLKDRYQAEILVAGSHRDSDELNGFEQKFGDEIHVFSDLSLLELIALIHRCNLFIGNDSGPMHIAASLGIPTIALFGPSDPRIWGPLGNGPKKMFQASGFDCMPCDQKNCVRLGDHCMLYIQPKEVIKGIEEILEPPQKRKLPWNWLTG